MSFLAPSDPLWERISAVVTDEGFSLYDVERLTSSSLRLSIARGGIGSRGVTNAEPLRNGDGQPQPGNSQEIAADEEVTSRVRVGDCTRVCRRLMVVFAAEGGQFGFSGEPEIEVSSPGVNRQLRLPEHFEGAVGERVKVVMREALAAFCDANLVVSDPALSVAGPKKSAAPSSGNQSANSTALVGHLADVVQGLAVVKEERSGLTYRIPIREVKRAHVEFEF